METNSIFETALRELHNLALESASMEGQNFTIISYMSIYRRSEKSSTIPSVLTPSMCLVLSGTKRINIGTEVIDYSVGEYLASVIDVPVSGQVLEASHKMPYIGIRIDFTNDKIADVALRSKVGIKPQQKKGTLNAGAFVGKADIGLLHILIHMLKLNNSKKEQPFLYDLYMQELIYNLLSSSYGHFLTQQVQLFQQATGIGQAITWIKENFEKSLTIEELAKRNNMSSSSLHHKFKAIVTIGPKTTEVVGS